MRVCHVCSGHSEDDGRVFHRECVTLAEAGYEVHLIARSARHEAHSNRAVSIHPLPDPKSRQERLARRWSVARMAASLCPDLYHVHEPELIGPVLAVAGPHPVIWDVHESYLDVLMDRHWIPKWARPVVRTAWDIRERQLVRRCAGVVVATDLIAPRYRAIHDKVLVVANFPILSEPPCAVPPSNRAPSCVFTGTIAPNRGILQVIQALAVLKRRGTVVMLHLAGKESIKGFIDRLIVESDSLGIRDQVIYHGFLSKAQTLELQGKASIGLVPHLPGYGNNLAAWPVKMFEFMAMGLPLVYSNIPNHLEITRGLEVGIAVDPTQPGLFADAIERLVRSPEAARAMGEAGRRAVRERFNWDVERARLLGIYDEILKN